jgi:hypothetical protein
MTEENLRDQIFSKTPPTSTPTLSNIGYEDLKAYLPLPATVDAAKPFKSTVLWTKSTPEHSTPKSSPSLLFNGRWAVNNLINQLRMTTLP